jgi:hypothetical protein
MSMQLVAKELAKKKPPSHPPSCASNNGNPGFMAKGQQHARSPVTAADNIGERFERRSADALEGTCSIEG